MLVFNPSALGQPLKQCGPILRSLGWTVLSVEDLLVANSIDVFPLVQGHTLVVQDMTVGTCVERPGFEVSDLGVAVTIDTIALGVALIVQDMLIATQIDDIVMDTILNVADLSVATKMDTPKLVPDTRLVVADLLMRTALDRVGSGTVVGAVVVTFEALQPEVVHTAI